MVNREKTIEICEAMASHFAEKFNYDKVMYAGHTLGVWDREDLGGLGSTVDKNGKVTGRIHWKAGSMSKILAKEYGEEVLQETYFYSSDEDDSAEGFTPKNYVEMRYRFANPCVAIHENGNQYMGEIQFGPTYPCDENGHFLRNESGWLLDADESDYQMTDLIIFREKGLAWANMLLDEWKRRVKEAETAKIEEKIARGQR